MIVMLVSGESQKERQCITEHVKALAAKWTDEYWDIRQCGTIEELGRFVGAGIKTDVACVDITMKGALELTKRLRAESPTTYIILIAGMQISPLTYMRPTIGAESLMLKPLSEGQVCEVLDEAIGIFARRFERPDSKKVFVVESKGGRELVDYERINFFESREKRIYLNTDMEEYGFYDTLDALEERLSELFLRCHRSFLVNKKKINKIYLSQNRMRLEGDFEIPLSRTYKSAVKKYLAEEGKT